MFGLGTGEILLAFGLAVLFFGGSKIPSLGKSLGEAISGFRRGVAGKLDEGGTGKGE